MKGIAATEEVEMANESRQLRSGCHNSGEQDDPVELSRGEGRVRNDEPVEDDGLQKVLIDRPATCLPSQSAAKKRGTMAAR